MAARRALPSPTFEIVEVPEMASAVERAASELLVHSAKRRREQGRPIILDSSPLSPIAPEVMVTTTEVNVTVETTANATNATNTTDWIGNGKKATNGSRDANTTRPLLNGYPSEYACPTKSGRRSLQLAYAYEVAVEDNGDVSQFWSDDLPAMEWGLLYLVSDGIGLRKCHLESQDIPIGQRRLQTEDPLVVSLRSTQMDAPDLRLGTFLVCDTHV